MGWMVQRPGCAWDHAGLASSTSANSGGGARNSELEREEGLAEGHGGFEFCVDEASPGRNRGHCFVVVRSGNVNEPPLQAHAGNLLGGGSRTCKSRLDRRSLGPPWRRRAGGRRDGGPGRGWRRRGLRLFAGEGGLWWIPAPTCWKGLPSIGDAASESASPSLHVINLCRRHSIWTDERLYRSARAGGAVFA